MFILHTFLLNTNDFLNKYIRRIDVTLTSTNTSGDGSNGMDWVIHFFEISKNRDSTLDAV